MKVNFIKSFRLKIAIYTVISLAGTLLTDSLVIFGLYVHGRQYMLDALNGVNLQDAGMGSSLGRQAMPGMNGYQMRMPGLTHNLALDLLILFGFSGIVFIIFFILVSHNMVNYLREISAGIDRIKEGDLDTNIRIKNEDELSLMAHSLNEMRMHLKEVMEKERVVERTKNELITNVAHDLRTPLTSIIGYLNLIQSEVTLTEQIRNKYINIAYEKAKHLQSLVEALFDYTRYAKDKMLANKGRMDLKKFMEQLVEEFYPSFQDAGLECQAAYCRESVYLNADGELLARALGNLLMNAVKYGADGKLILVKLSVDGETLKVTITNFGRMIPIQDLEKIFDKFYRVEGSRSLNTGGAGLGLAIAKNIISMHDGTITAKSDTNGTIFEVTLPLEPKEMKGTEKECEKL